MTSHRGRIIELFTQGIIPKPKINDALTALKITPDGKSWRIFIDHLLLYLGGLALAFSLMFFIAYNWKDIGHFAKFGMVEGFMALSIAVYCKYAENSIISKVLLLVATVSLGVLLALYGQTYQTGADPWELFFCWAFLMVPWAVIGRFPAIWIVWVALINTSIILYSQTFEGIFGFVFSSESSMLWLIFFFNTLIFVAWQFLERTWVWLSERWAICLLALGSAVPLTWLVLFSIIDYRGGGGFSVLLWMGWLVAMYATYRIVKTDLFMLAVGCLSGITVTVTFLGKHLLPGAEAGAFLVLAIIVIVMGGGAAMWLKEIYQETMS